MSLKIEARPEISRRLLYVTPLLAVALTVVAGFFIFLLMGYDPLLALYHFFISPRDQPLRPLRARAQGGAADHDRGRPGARLPRQRLEHRRRGPADRRRDRGRRRRAPVLGPGGLLDPAPDVPRRHARRHGLRRDPGVPQDPARRQRDPDQPDADLRRDPVPQHAGLRALEGPPGLRLPAVADAHRRGAAAGDPGGHAAPSRRAGRAAGRDRRLGRDDPHRDRLRDQGRGPGAGGGRLRGLRSQPHDLALPL